MDVRLASLFRAVLFGSLIVGLSATAQQDQQQRPQNRPAPGGEHQGGPPNQGNRPGGPPNQGNRPGGPPNQGNRPGGPPNQAGPNRPPQQGNVQRPPQQANRPQQPPRPPNRPPAQINRPPNRPVQRPPQWGRPPASRPTYNFRPSDRTYLRNFYASRLRGINRARRPIFRVGTYFPLASIGFLSPVPPSMWGMLPPIPPGYAAGFYDGYVVIYDPTTFWIVGVVDLL